MKFYVFIIASLVFYSASAQHPIDSVHAKYTQIDSAYQERLKKEKIKPDTITTKDSIVISYRSKTQKLIKKNSYVLDRHGCHKWIYKQYYNQDGLLTYRNSHSQTCAEKKAEEGIYEFFLLYHERFEYDNKGDIALHVFMISSVDSYKDTYYTDELFIRKYKRTRIKYRDFWKAF